MYKNNPELPFVRFYSLLTTNTSHFYKSNCCNSSSTALKPDTFPPSTLPPSTQFLNNRCCIIQYFSSFLLYLVFQTLFHMFFPVIFNISILEVE